MVADRNRILGGNYFWILCAARFVVGIGGSGMWFVVVIMLNGRFTGTYLSCRFLLKASR